MSIIKPNKRQQKDNLTYNVLTRCALALMDISKAPITGWQPEAKVFWQKMHFHVKQDHLRMNVASDQTIILSLQIFLDHRSLSSIDQKILMTLPAPQIIHLKSYSFVSKSRIFIKKIHHFFVNLEYSLQRYYLF